MKTRQLIIFSILITQILYIFTGKCGVNKLNIKPKVSTLMEKANENEMRFLQDKTWVPIKMVADYTYLDTQQSKVSKEKIELAKKVTENTLNMYRNLLSIKRINKFVKLNDGCGDELSIEQMSKDLSSTGIETDIVIFPIFVLNAEATTEAYAFPCHMDPTSNRPISGLMAFNPENFKTEIKNAVEYYTMLVVHEINHILSFNLSLFEYFVNPDTFAKLNKSDVVKEINVNGLTKQAIVTPKVVATARKHFNCDKIEGVELENQGGDGTAGSHWDARVMLGDFMIGETYPENILSEITLALFEDSGWY